MRFIGDNDGMGRVTGRSRWLALAHAQVKAMMTAWPNGKQEGLT